MNNRDIAKEWFNFAQNDLKSAKFLLQMNPIPLEIICYHCQQSAEKYLKGYIALKGGNVIKTHDLTYLNKFCVKYDNDYQKIEDDCVELVDYGVQVRYPFSLALEDYDMKNAIKSANTIRDFILDKVK